MKIELSTISMTRLLAFIILGLLIMAILVVFIVVQSENEAYKLLGILIAIPVFIMAHLFSQTRTKVDLSDPDSIKINDEVIPLNNIVEYYLNKKALTTVAIELKLTTKRYIQITSLNFGKKNQQFKRFQDILIKHMKGQKPEMAEVDFQEIYAKPSKNMRFAIYILAGIIILLDIFLLYALITGKMDLPWQFIFLNLLLVFMIPYAKKAK